MGCVKTLRRVDCNCMEPLSTAQTCFHITYGPTYNVQNIYPMSMINRRHKHLKITKKNAIQAFAYCAKYLILFDFNLTWFEVRYE